MPWKLAANLSLLFTSYPVLERVGAAAKGGFDGVEVQFPYDVPAKQWHVELSRQSIPLVLFNLPAGDLMQGGPGLAGVPGREAAFAQAVSLALDYARVLQPEKVNVLPGRRGNNVDRGAALDTLTANLRFACNAFEPLGIGVVCEAINCVDMPGSLVSTSSELAEVIARVEHPNLSAQLDLYHMARMGEDLSSSVLRLAGKIGHVQFADVPGRGAPGTGVLDFSVARAALEKAGYTGWLAAEYRTELTDDLAWLTQWRTF